MRTVGHWLDHHYGSKDAPHLHWGDVVDFVKSLGVDLLLIVFGLFAVITAIIIAHPALAYLAAKFFS